MAEQKHDHDESIKRKVKNEGDDKTYTRYHIVVH